MKIGDKVKWNDGVHGTSSGEVLAPDSDGTDLVVIAMDTLADAKPIVGVDTKKLSVADEKETGK